MQLGGNVADVLVKQPIDERMNVFVRGDRLGARVETPCHRIEASLDLLALGDGENSGAVERHCPGFRQFDVEWPQAKIDANRVIERVELGRSVSLEPAAPKLVGLGGRIDERCRRHATASSGVAGASCAGLLLPVDSLPIGNAISCSTDEPLATEVRANSWSFNAPTRAGRANRRMNPAASLCSYTSSSPNVTKRSS